MRVRVKFSKLGKIKYVGHLDTMRLIQRAIKTAELPICYSQGFSPHSLVYFALPLPVGMSSEGDYMDLMLESPMTPNQIKEALQKVLVEGITLLDTYEVEEKSASLMSLVQGADYHILLKTEQEVTAYSLEKQLESSNALFVTKKSKKGMIEVDIKPLLLKSHFKQQQTDIDITIQVYAGSHQNLSPELFIKALLKEQQYTMQVTRKELYTLEDRRLIAIDKVGRLYA